jgi:hypothetical protein
MEVNNTKYVRNMVKLTYVRHAPVLRKQYGLENVFLKINFLR